MHTQHHHEEGAACGAGAPARSVARTDAPPALASAVPFSNTGRKNEVENPVVCPQTGEPSRGGEQVEFITTGKVAWAVIHPLPDETAAPQAALIDWLAFTLNPPLQIALMARADGCEDSGYRWMCGELVRLFKVEADDIERQKTGGSGYKYRARFPGGHILWGGKNQRGTINVSLSGEGCARIDDWPTIAAWLESQRAKLKRVDLAYDDFAGETISIEKLREWYDAGEFGAGGRKPEAQLVDDLGSGKGRTLYVGNRKNGKLFRGYEKGKQLGDPNSRWVRAECEWHDKSRHLPYDMLTRPGQYLAGAYPSLHCLNIEQSKIKTVFRAAKIAFERALDNLRQQGGKLVNLALAVYGGDYAAVVDRIRRDGIPARVEPYSYHIEETPERLANDFGMMASAAK